MKEKDNALRCTTYDGKTPLMTAVRYGSGVALSVSLRSQSENPDLSMINSMSIFPYIAKR
jgi:ankyrin repeat protein